MSTATALCIDFLPQRLLFREQQSAVRKQKKGAEKSRFSLLTSVPDIQFMLERLHARGFFFR